MTNSNIFMERQLSEGISAAVCAAGSSVALQGHKPEHKFAPTAQEHLVIVQGGNIQSRMDRQL